MKVAVVGAGIVGEAVGVGLSLHDHTVTFCDTNRSKLAYLREQGYRATSNVAEAIDAAEIVFVCVSTPTVDGKADFSLVRTCTKKIGKALKDYAVVAFKSTLLPQTTRTVLLPTLKEYAKTDFGVCVNPEFLRQRSALADFMVPDRIVIGELNRESGDKLAKLYSSFHCPIIRTDLDTAEMIKYASNLFLAAKISFFNEMHLISQTLKVNSGTVSKAVSLDRRIGSYGVQGGRPFSGACLPKDLSAFNSFIKESTKLNPKLLENVEEINQTIKHIKGNK